MEQGFLRANAFAINADGQYDFENMMTKNAVLVGLICLVVSLCCKINGVMKSLGGNVPRYIVQLPHRFSSGVPNGGLQLAPLT